MVYGIRRRIASTELGRSQWVGTMFDLHEADLCDVLKQYYRLSDTRNG